MSPDKRRPPKKAGTSPATRQVALVKPDAEAPHKIVYFRRHVDDSPAEPAPGRIFLDNCPKSVSSLMRNVLIAVSEAKPGEFAGGGYWEPMHGEMSGFWELRATGPKRRQFRLFCIMDTNAEGFNSLLVIITGMSKPWMTKFASKDYKAIRQLRDEYLARNPRSLVD